MKKNGILYAIVWASILALFNFITFITPAEIGGQSKYTTMFWVSYAFVTVIFVVQLLVTFFAFYRLGPEKSIFYRLPVIKTSIVATVVSFFLALPFMIVPQIPPIIGAILLAVLLVVVIIMYARALMVPNGLEAIDKQIRVQTAFTKMLIADSQALVDSVDDEATKKVCVEVHEAIRYSDPMSVAECQDLEGKISEYFVLFKDAVENNNQEEIRKNSKLLLNTISQRNARIKMLK